MCDSSNRVAYMIVVNPESIISKESKSPITSNAERELCEHALARAISGC